jgi:hypothetical protein
MDPYRKWLLHLELGLLGSFYWVHPRFLYENRLESLGTAKMPLLTASPNKDGLTSPPASYANISLKQRVTFF